MRQIPVAAASAGLLLGLLPGAWAQDVPPSVCNSDFARTYMLEHVAHQLFIPPEKIAAIGTLGGAGGDAGSSGKPGDRDYHSELNCPIRVTLAGGGHQFMTYHERFSTIYGEEVKFTPFAENPNNPQLKWVDTQLR